MANRRIGRVAAATTAVASERSSAGSRSDLEAALQPTSPTSMSSTTSFTNTNTNTANGRHASTTATTTTTNAITDPLRVPHPNADISALHGLVQRRFYAAEMSTARAEAYASGALPLPIQTLDAALDHAETLRERILTSSHAGRCVVHWFRTDLRTRDNTGLGLAGLRARQLGGYGTRDRGAGVRAIGNSSGKGKNEDESSRLPVVGLYIISPRDWEAHFDSPGKIDLHLRSVRFLQQRLESEYGIPLWVEVVSDRRRVPETVLRLCQKWSAAWLTANMEYEVDELRRDETVVREGETKGVAVEIVHDTCVVPPGRLRSGAGTYYAVYSPWYRAWTREIVTREADLLAERPVVGINLDWVRDDDTFGALFGCAVPDAPEGKRLEPEKQREFERLWPAGEDEAMRRLEEFLGEKVEGYADRRNFPADAGTANLSVHFRAGTLAARTAVRKAMEANGGRVTAGSPGVQTWIREVAWRDFYRHVLVRWPYVW